jgi:hypothetical protein
VYWSNEANAFKTQESRLEQRPDLGWRAGR